MSEHDHTPDDERNDPEGELSDADLEQAAGGVIGTDTDGDGIIDGGCTDPVLPILLKP